MIKRRKIKKRTLLLLLTIFIIQIPSIYADEEYQHILTLESPNPDAQAMFGYQVKISGNIITVSEPKADVDDVTAAGKVYIYDTNGDLISTLQSPTPGTNNYFGQKLDLFGDTVVIREPWADIGELTQAGKAHMFTTDGTHQLTLQSPKPKTRAIFGTAGIYNDIMVIYEGTSEGIVHMFDSEGVYLKTLHSPNPSALGKFGLSIEVGDTLILIAEAGLYDFHDAPLPRGPGSVHVFNHDGDHLMTLQAPEPEEHAFFGNSISISGDKIVVGECFATVNDLPLAGRAYIFNTDGEYLHTFQSPTPKSGGHFGESVAIDGNRVIVGEPNADVNPLQYEGRAYVFDVDGTLLANLTAPSPYPRAWFGIDVDIDEDVILVGESYAALDDLNKAGRAHVYTLGEIEAVSPEVEETPKVIETEPVADDTRGWIPGFPVAALILGSLLTVIFITQRKR